MRKALAASPMPVSVDDEARLRERVRGALERTAANDEDDSCATDAAS
jgi:hypothetical protein